MARGWAEFHCKVVSRARVEVNDEYRDAINTVVTRKPIAGYTPKEIKKFERGDPIIHLYFSADKELIPLKLPSPLILAKWPPPLTDASSA